MRFEKIKINSFKISFILGIVGIIASLIPALGYIFNVSILILNIKNDKKQKNNYSKAGIILSIIGLIFTLLNSILSIILFFKNS